MSGKPNIKIRERHMFFGWYKFKHIEDRILVISETEQLLLPESCFSCDGHFEYTAARLRAVLEIYDGKNSIIFTGETGTGKEYFYKYIQKHYSKKKLPTRQTNCAAFADSNIIDSELFGHIKGSFSGATGERIGLARECENGLLFLDEVRWMPKPAQAKLLRFMETGEVRPFGSDKIITVQNVRIIAATNGSIDAETRERREPKDRLLLEDFIFRFNHAIVLPPLRERGTDMFWFLPRLGFLGGAKQKLKNITIKALYNMLSYDWPGNLREISKYCQRKILFYPDQETFICDDYAQMRASERSLRSFLPSLLAGAEYYQRLDRIPRSDYYYRLIGLLINFAFPGEKCGRCSYGNPTMKRLFADSVDLTIPIPALVSCLYQAPSNEKDNYWDPSYIEEFFYSLMKIYKAKGVKIEFDEWDDIMEDHPSYSFSNQDWSLDSVILVLYRVTERMQTIFDMPVNVVHTKCNIEVSMEWVESILNRPEVKNLQTWLDSFTPPATPEEIHSEIERIIEKKSDSLDKGILKCFKEDVTTAPAIATRLGKNKSTIRDRIKHLYQSERDLERLVPKLTRGRPQKKEKTTKN